MKHRTDCPGHCGTWTDQHHVKWNLCRMTDKHLEHVECRLQANVDRLTVEYQETWGAILTEIGRRRNGTAPPSD